LKNKKTQNHERPDFLWNKSNAVYGCFLRLLPVAVAENDFFFCQQVLFTWNSHIFIHTAVY